MAKVTVKETPSEAVINKANELVYVTDSKGRKLGLKQPHFLEEFRIVEALGHELSSNTTYMQMLNPLLFLAEIDGESIAAPRTKLAAEGLIQRAGREGYLAVLKGITQHFAVDTKEFENAIKNVEGTPA